MPGVAARPSLAVTCKESTVVGLCVTLDRDIFTCPIYLHLWLFDRGTCVETKQPLRSMERGARSFCSVQPFTYSQQVA